MDVEEIIKSYEGAIIKDIADYKDPKRPDLNLGWLTGRLYRHKNEFYHSYRSYFITKETQKELKQFDEMFNGYEEYLKSEHY